MVLHIKRDTITESSIPAIAVKQSHSKICSPKNGALSFTTDNKISGNTKHDEIHFIADTFAGNFRSRYCIHIRVNTEYETN